METNKGGHEETIRVCPKCKWLYVVQHGGQKSGSSPYVSVREVGGKATGYCSPRCRPRKSSLKDTKAWYKSFGVDYDEVFPPGYLAPSRIPRVLVQVARIRILQEQVANGNGRR
ncbi:MAG: hypothetical protein US39_C0001G0152 [Microgenomates group bacterium GW2011_GWC1_37_12b]|uniref:Uncharacterized protein n=1 Tax=Candidatus Woesebacteria bacterium GW2011_GWB1_38_8b TaxID=1618571 RepID=A0A0G0L5M2_9BACT|nr:MAG: hypothetical protein US39_C0001G0152 [Microgenomates group bacterium GW2011_GWC1_37_12b]KKQ87303.1 MAG: hypothetical protein UT10_C0008G0064 [Candidatus Woesebacteria bacterium GW2011_GWB1_38_8b]